MKEINHQYLPQLFSAAMIMVMVMVWIVFLKILSWPLGVQRDILQGQLHQIQVLRELPQKWEHQIGVMSIIELMAILNKTWLEFLPKSTVLQIEQVSAVQLQARANKVDEQAFLQWLWAMQQQYAFQIVKLNISPANRLGFINLQVDLQLLRVH